MSADHLGPADAPDRFALVRQLGRGSMGVVYEAHDRVTGHRVALKTLAHGEAQFLADLKREFRLVQNVAHPNLVRLEGLFQGEGTWFLTMELLDGRDFLTWVRDGDSDEGGGSERAAPGSTTQAPRFPRDAAALPGAARRPSLAPATRQVATSPAHDGALASEVIERLHHTLPQLGRALEALHAEGLVHRDVKPRNVLVTGQNRLVLLDFGLARAAGEDPQGWTLAGTPAYMAPEQGEGGAVTAAADCYAVGVMLYQVLTGRLPFVGTRDDLLLQKRSWSPAAPSLLRSGVPEDLEALCLRLLALDPAARPSAAELARHQRRDAGRSVGSVGPAAAAAPIFVGRARELARVRRAFELAFEPGAGAAPPGGAAGPAVVVVEGESGIGKTALLREATGPLAAELAGAHALVLRGRCFEREVTAYAGVDMIMDALIAQLGRLDDVAAAAFTPRHLAALRQIFPALAAIPAFDEDDERPPAGHGHQTRQRAAAAFAELFARVAARYPLVLAIDDAQWLTEASLLLLRSLLGAAPRVPLVLLLAARGPGLERLEAWLGTLGTAAVRLPLGPLSTDESVELLRHHLARDARELAAMAHDAAGHPYLLRELALAAETDAASDAPGGAPSGPATAATGDAPRPATPRQVEEILRERASRLSASERAVLDLVCAATTPLGQRVVAAAARLSPGDIAGVTAQLVRQRYAVVTPDSHGGSILPAHDRVRAALRAAADDDARRRLARCLAEALELHAGEDVESLAQQWSLAGELARAAGFARTAGDRAMDKLAFERAAEHYALALRGAPPDDASDAAERPRAALLVRLGDALAAAGRGPEAAAAYLQAAAGQEGRDDRATDDLVMRAADQLLRSGQINEGKQLLTRVLERLGIRPPTSSAAAVRMVLLRRLALQLRGLTPRTIADEARRREALRRIDACWLVGDLLAILDPLRAIALHTRGLSLALDVGEPYRLARSLCTEAALVVQPGRKKRAVAFGRLALAERLAREVGAPQLAGYVALGKGIVQLLTGDFDDAQGNLDQAEATFERCPGAYWEVGFARDFALWTLAYRGHLPELAQRLDAAVALFAARGDRLGSFKLLVGPSRVALLARDQPEQLLEACRMDALGLSPKEHSFLAFCALFGRVNAFLYLGRAADALDALDAARPEIRDSHVLYCQFHRVELAYLRGRAALARLGECAAAERRPFCAKARAAIRALRRERVPWGDAMARVLEGSLALAETKDPVAAIAALAAGASALEATGLRAYAHAVRWQLHHALEQPAAVAGAPPPWDGVVLRPDRFAHALAPLASPPRRSEIPRARWGSPEVLGARAAELVRPRARLSDTRGG